MKNLTKYLTEKLHIGKNPVNIKTKPLKNSGDGNIKLLGVGFPFRYWNSGRFTFMKEYCDYFIKRADEFGLNDEDVNSLRYLKLDLINQNISTKKDEPNYFKTKMIYDMINYILSHEDEFSLTVPRKAKLNKILNEVDTADIEIMKNNLRWQSDWTN